MNPNTNSNSNSNAVWYVIIVIVILVAAYFLFRGNDTAMTNDESQNTASSTNSAGDAMTGGNNTGGTNGTGSTGGTNSGTTASNIPSDATILGMVNVAKIRVPSTGTDVALSNGTTAYKNGAKDGRVTMGDIIGKYVTEDGYDVLVNMAVQKDTALANANPSNYAALFHVKGTTATFKSAVLIGEGIIVTSADAKSNNTATMDKNPAMFESAIGYSITIHYLDRRTGATATTTPTMAKDLSTTVKNHMIY